MTKHRFTVVDLFSGAGGMSFGFASHPAFKIVFAVDAQQGKPSSGPGSLECNSTYSANIPLEVKGADLTIYSPEELTSDSGLRPRDLDVLISGAPCTGFSRANPKNHLEDDPRNDLIGRTGDFVEALLPKVFVMENVRELLTGRFSHHWTALRDRLERLGYATHAKVYLMTEFGLPQTRERSIIVAARQPATLRTLEELWEGYTVDPACLTVRHAIGHLPPLAAGESDPMDPEHTSPALQPLTLERLRAIPKNGGSWTDLIEHPAADRLLTPAMKRFIETGRTNSYSDIYGRLQWDKPSVTIKRESSHVGNGRYSHPEQDRLLSVREMAILTGFPSTYRFAGKSLSNKYRHVGDACPPLISYQLAHVCHWILTGEKPDIFDCILPNTTLRPEHIIKAPDTHPVQTTLVLDSP